LLDIDHFKKVNDSFGHPVGDQVLVHVASVLSECVRATDTVGRWGGEEFLIICPETDALGAAALAENLRHHIAGHPFPTAGNQSASFGVAEHRSGESMEATISRADTALYRAKNEGRNRVVVAD
jgi:diguanylate cyclase (GGDEF)-like protein